MRAEHRGSEWAALVRELLRAGAQVGALEEIAFCACCVHWLQPKPKLKERRGGERKRETYEVSRTQITLLHVLMSAVQQWKHRRWSAGDGEPGIGSARPGDLLDRCKCEGGSPQRKRPRVSLLLEETGRPEQRESAECETPVDLGEHEET
ncbi:hypothetical protein K438DRAFT_1753421 [Mycena galopus ATCC 62051]|nr:hypothetical protein K438DRAFT_1753421 [Mycena galopus ATCC 62051]